MEKKMYWLFSAVIAICILAIILYKRKNSANNFWLNYGQRAKQLEKDFQELSEAAVESLESATTELTTVLENANLAIQELHVEINKAEKLIYEARLARGKELSEQQVNLVDQQLSELQAAVTKAEKFDSILEKEKISENIFQQEPKYEKISNLLNAAVTEQEIAKSLNVGYAEINLVKYLKEKT